MSDVNPRWGPNAWDWTGTGRHFQPQFDRSLRQAQADWDEGLRKWDSGDDPDRERFTQDGGEPYPYEEWNGERPGDDDLYYRPDWPEDVELGYQLYETVSEGTPLSPSFATAEELARFLIYPLAMFDSFEAAMRFVDVGWAPSFMDKGDGRGLQPGYEVVAEEGP
jgi:hypothetical protein